MAEKKVKLIAKTRVFVPDHGPHGTHYEPGQVFELPPERAERAVALGAAEYAQDKEQKKEQK